MFYNFILLICVCVQCNKLKINKYNYLLKHLLVQINSLHLHHRNKPP